MRTIEFRAMGCRVFAALDNPSTGAANRLKRVPQWFEGWEQSLSRFREDSELSQVNRSAGVPVHVSQEFWEVFQATQEAERSSRGLVTPAVLDAMLSAGYVRSFDPVAQPPAVSPKAETPIHRPESVSEKPVLEKPALKMRWRESSACENVAPGISVSVESYTLCLPAGLRLDFGGIAKGWAAQKAVDRLRIYGPALVDAGGDIAISGLLSGSQPWQVGVADPFNPDSHLEVLQLGRCGIATSGRDYRRWKWNGAWQHHIIDPRTGCPAVTDVISTTVVAPTLVEAEVAAKVALILGSQAGLDWLENQPSTAGLLVLEDGQRLYSSRFDTYRWSE